MIDLSNQIVWITGGTRGIGLELAKQLIGHNCKIIISSSSEKSISAAKAQFSSIKNILVLNCDVSDNEQIQNCYGEICYRFGKVTALINNAGIFKSTSVLKSSIEDFDNTMNINLKGAFLSTKAVLPAMISAEFGIIMNTISVVTRKPFAGCSIYSASKAGLEAFANVLREEVRKSGIRVINVFPGATATEIWDSKSIEKFGSSMMAVHDVATAMKDVLIQSFTNKIAIEEIQLRPVGGDL